MQAFYLRPLNILYDFATPRLFGAMPPFLFSAKSNQAVILSHLPKVINPETLVSKQVLSIKRAGSKIFSDERILGSSDFVKNAVMDAEEKEKETLRLNSKISGLEILPDRIGDGEGVEKMELCSGRRKRDVVKCRKIFCRMALASRTSGMHPDEFRIADNNQLSLHS